ncbi:acetylglutamate kinase [Thalassotalea sp. PS06]|uniref:acetylglutamate kinase n=1 Tax=Thalassotalea sp. PS06 TaxID=2594005 RepID=UPI00116596FD|nr:acetylglutamate kinase [Thalassotalea sp. PS06]QDP00053.1 acetylglutamate kinase [Thalassotalea sp. PS06]
MNPLVIKIGGAIMENAAALDNLFSVLLTLQKDRGVVIVHGGGCIVDEHLSQAGFSSDKINGLRVSAKEHMPIISGALAGTVNKQLVAQANSKSINAVGLALHDGNMVHCKPADKELGQVGIPSPANADILNSLLSSKSAKSANMLPIICSIGQLADGQLVNVNADDAAVAISELIDGELLLLTDVAGVKGANGEYLTSLNQQDAKQLITDGIIAGGMIAKVNAAFAAANRLRRSIAVTSWKAPEQLLTLHHGELLGTRIEPNE